MGLLLQKEPVKIGSNQELHASLWMPEEASGVVVFANECNGRLRPYGDYLANALCEARLATLSVDIPAQPAPAGSLRQDCEAAPMSSLCAACDWLSQYPPTAGLPLGLCGIGRNACAALLVAAELGHRVCAVVVRGAQPDLSILDALMKISASTLLIVGGLDEGAAEKNRVAYTVLRCRKRFEIIPGATGSVDEPGSFEVGTRLMRSWFVQQVHFSCA